MSLFKETGKKMSNLFSSESAAKNPEVLDVSTAASSYRDPSVGSLNQVANKAEIGIAEEYFSGLMAQAAMNTIGTVSSLESHLSAKMPHAAHRFKAIADTCAAKSVMRIMRY